MPVIETSAAVGIFLLATRVVVDVAKYIKEVNASDKWCKEILRKIDFYKSEIESFILASENCSEKFDTTHMKPFIEHFEKIKTLCEKYTSKGKLHKIVWSDKELQEIDENFRQAEASFAMFLHINNAKEILKVSANQSVMAKSLVGIFGLLTSLVEAPDKELKPKLDEMSKKMEQNANEMAKMLQKRSTKVEQREQQPTEKLEDQKLTAELPGSVAKPLPKAHAVLLKLYKRSPKVVKSGMSAVSVFLKCGLAGLKLYNDTKSNEERAKHLISNLTRKNISRYYAEQFHHIIQNLAM